jgi:hypothetical protein
LFSYSFCPSHWKMRNPGESFPAIPPYWFIILLNGYYVIRWWHGETLPIISGMLPLTLTSYFLFAANLWRQRWCLIIVSGYTHLTCWLDLAYPCIRCTATQVSSWASPRHSLAFTPMNVYLGTGERVW